MKIIAKTKDYYDYLQGKYGIDPKLVYDRRDGISMPDQSVYNRDGDTVLISVAGIYYPAIWSEGVWHYDKATFIKCDRNSGKKNYFGGNNERWFNVNHLLETDVNIELREPVLFKESFKDWKKPLTLQQFNFHKVMSAEQVYVAISGFLGWLVDNPPIPDKQTNREKILSHGFDLKKSFRH